MGGRFVSRNIPWYSCTLATLVTTAEAGSCIDGLLDQERSQSLHDFSPTLQDVAARIAALDLTPDRVSQGQFRQLRVDPLAGTSRPERTVE